MKKKGFMFLVKNLIFLLFFISLIGIVSATTTNCTNCSDCSSAIQSAGSGDIIQLNTSLSNIDGNCIEFFYKDNITFDCLGNTIDGDYDYDGYGIKLNSTGGDGSDNNTIRNCNVKEFNYGIHLDDSTNNNLVNITSNNNTYTGIYLDGGSNNNNLTNITTNNNTEIGIIFWYTYNNTVINLTANYNDNGIDYRGNENTLFKVEVKENTYRDIAFLISSSSRCQTTNFTNITGSGGRAIEFYNSQATIEDKELSMLILCNTDNSSIDNITIRGSDILKNNGLHIRYIDNTNISNINSSNNYYGIYIETGGDNNILTNITTNNNSEMGLWISSGDYNNITNITSNYNDGSGIYLTGVKYNLIRDATINSNPNGLYTQYADNNTLTNITANSNSKGIVFYKDSEYNILNDSHIENSTTYGLYFDSTTGSYPQYNIIYNNLLNNSVNSYNDTNLTNYFNTTNTSGFNIMEGIWVGGNYWTNSTGNDFSDTCTDSDSDGICDSSYSVDGDNYDYLPLSSSQPTGCNSCSDCSTKIQSASSGETIYLSQGISNYTGACIDFNGADNITFDCQIYSNFIEGNTTNAGIYLSSTGDGSNNNTIQNCNITDFYQGLLLGVSNNNTLTNITANSNSYGIYVSSSSGNILKNNNMSNNTYNFRVYGTSNSQYNNIIDTSNIVDYSYKIYYNYSISDYVFDSTTAPNAGMAVCILCNNVTYKDLNLSHYNYYGLHFFNVSNSHILNITSNYNRDGLYLYKSYNNTLTNLKSTYNSDDGLELDNFNNNTFSNIISKFNSYGIYISQSDNNNFTNITISSNKYYGSYFHKDSDYNIIKNSHIENNTEYGAKFGNVGSDYPEYNKIYNNIFNNTVNYYNTTNLTNYFNTTNTSGTNIVGGSWIGGNYWENWSAPGTGFSEACTDADEDKICDSSYNVDGVNQSYDYLPLVYNLTCTELWTYSAWSTCIGGTQTRTATDENNCGTTNDRLPLSQSCTAEPGGGSGIIKEQPTQTHVWDIITANEPATMTIIEPDIHLTEITITTSETLTDVSLTVTEIDVTPQSDIQIMVEGINYQGFKIDTTKLNDTNIVSAVIEFKVNKTWLDNLNLTYDDVSLYRKPGRPNIWDALNTTFLTEDSQYYYFSAVSLGFSTFVIFIGTRACNPGDLRCFNNELQLCVGNYTWVVTEKCRAGCENNECVEGGKIVDISTGSLLVYSIVIVLSAGILVVLYFVFRFLSKKHSQSIWKESKETEESISNK